MRRILNDIEAGKVSDELQRRGIPSAQRLRVVVEIIDVDPSLTAINAAGGAFDWLADEARQDLRAVGRAADALEVEAGAREDADRIDLAGMAGQACRFGVRQKDCGPARDRGTRTGDADDGHGASPLGRRERQSRA